MNIELKNVKVVVLNSSGADEVYIIPENITMGSWPYDENQGMKTLVAKGSSKKWLVSNFGADVIKHAEFKDV